MKRIILTYLLAFISFSLLSQKTNSNLGYLIGVKGGNEVNSQILSKGDEIVVRLMNNKKVRGKIMESGQDYLVIDSGDKFTINDINWIKKSKASPARLISGLTVLAVGVTTMVVLTQYVSFDVINQVGF